MKYLRLLIYGLFCTAVLSGTASAQASESGFDGTCEDANVFTNVFDQICWDCFLESVSLMGVSIDDEPDGVASKGPACFCQDDLGVPEAGFPVAFWRPARINEVVTTPWCSPSLGGIKLQDTLTGLGTMDKADSTVDGSIEKSFYQYHYFAYPIMEMLQMIAFPSCTDGYVDMDLMYISEIDPLWNDDLLSLILNPEAIIFANPLAKLWCMEDCVSTTLNNQSEEAYGCAGCDGNLYPLTGNVTNNTDVVSSSSLITQRVLASLHRKGLAKKTIGDEAMCKPEYFPTIPRSQYKFSLIHPVPEAASANADQAREYSENIADDPSQSNAKAPGVPGADVDAFNQCCHPMGMSTKRWCLPFGGRQRPHSSAYIFMIWNWRDCCTLNTPVAGDEGA